MDITNLRCRAELESIASSSGRETDSNPELPGAGEQGGLSWVEAEPQAPARPALADEADAPAGTVCELWLDGFCKGSRTKSYKQ